jgi:DNA-binding NarL/FixJ family response regulator
LSLTPRLLKGSDPHDSFSAADAVDSGEPSGLPDLDGVAVVEGLRGWSAAPIIVLSARHEEQAKVRALDAGADDYVTKPFGMDELLARVRAATRRWSPPTAAAVVITAALTIDLSARRVTSPSGDIRLTPTEWHLPEILVRGADQQVWGRPTKPSRITCGCTWPTCAGNWSPIRLTPAI